MANFEFKCPQCGNSVEAEDSWRGQVAECPHCGKNIVIPRATPRRPASGLRPVNRSAGATPASTGTPGGRLSEYERMAQMESRRRRHEAMIHTAKNIVQVLVAGGVLWGAWSIFKKNFMTAGTSEPQDVVPETISRLADKTNPVTTQKTAAAESPNHTSVNFSACKDKVVAIGNEGEGGGTAFLAKMDSKTYLVTSEHVAHRTDALRRVYLLDGTQIELGAFEVE